MVRTVECSECHKKDEGTREELSKRGWQVCDELTINNYQTSFAFCSNCYTSDKFNIIIHEALVKSAVIGRLKE